jgi:hypothetical protein
MRHSFSISGRQLTGLALFITPSIDGCITRVVAVGIILSLLQLIDLQLPRGVPGSD